MLRPGLWASALALIAMAALTAWAWPKVPADARIAIHWGTDGQANRYASKTAGLIAAPLIALGLTVVLAGLPWIDPRRRSLARSPQAYQAVWIGVMGLHVAIQALIVLDATGRRPPVDSVITAAVGVLFIVVGNYLPTLRRNWIAGARNPWTLSSELSWHRTQRLTGRLLALEGVAVLISAFALGPVGRLAVLLVGLVVLLVVTTAYSWWVWRGDPHKDPTGR
jgi:uncharacterized membrane protein